MERREVRGGDMLESLSQREASRDLPAKMRESR